MSSIQSTPFDLPGLTLPLDIKLEGPFTIPMLWIRMTSMIARRYTFTVREVTMTRIMESITDKPNWHEKVWNSEITTRWREEMSQNDLDISEEMKTYIIKELQWKAIEFQRTGLVTAYDPGVVKSDVAISIDLQQRLRDAVKPLEDVPGDEKDYHPGSDNKILEMVHPVLRDTLIGTDDCLMSAGHGKPIELYNLQGPQQERRQNVNNLSPYSQKFQWLPCNINFGNDGQCRIASYINNLHPTKYRDLYNVIENILDKTIPLWNVSLARRRDIPNRISYSDVEYLLSDEPEPEQENSDDDTCRHPGRPSVSIQDKGLQVIVKLTNIELTPDKPEICATAIYYYDSENITSHSLCFRHRIHEEDIAEFVYEQYEWTFLSVFGVVSCHQGRLLTFPNTLQHRVPHFSLCDRSKPGHRKIIALFLIDPNRSIISTANVPPQREDWCTEWDKAVDDVLSDRLPVELQNMRSAKTEVHNDQFHEATYSLCEH
ncbi:hypothetical protein BDV19DRAFT_379114 [Aspergillus venezuelensis]